MSERWISCGNSGSSSSSASLLWSWNVFIFFILSSASFSCSSSSHIVAAAVSTVRVLMSPTFNPHFSLQPPPPLFRITNGRIFSRYIQRTTRRREETTTATTITKILVFICHIRPLSFDFNPYAFRNSGVTTSVIITRLIAELMGFRPALLWLYLH